MKYIPIIIIISLSLMLSSCGGSSSSDSMDVTGSGDYSSKNACTYKFLNRYTNKYETRCSYTSAFICNSKCKDGFYKDCKFHIGYKCK